MENTEIAKVFREIADALATQNANIFKIRAYRKAAAAIETRPDRLTQLAREDRLREVPGVGPAIAKKILELVNTGELAYLRKLKTRLSEVNPGAPPPSAPDQDTMARRQSAR